MGKLKRLAQRAGKRARAGTPAEAAVDADALLLAVHWSRVPDVLRKAGDLSGKVLVTCSLAMNEDNTDLVIAHTSSAAEEIARKARGARVVSAFGTVPSEVFFGVYDSRKKKARRPTMIYCGDDDSAKKMVATLIHDAGFDPLDVGPLRIARYTEPFTLLMGQIAYELDRGPEVAYRLEWFK